MPLDQLAKNRAPLVTVVIPAYCASAYLRTTLNAVLAQTHTNLEVIVVDDGSVDETPQIIDEAASRDPRVRLLKQDHKGVAAARNAGIIESRGEFIALIDADDVWLPQTVDRQLSTLQNAGEEFGVSYSWSFDIDETGVPTGTVHAYTLNGDVYPILLCHNFLANASCTLIRTSALRSVGLFSLLFNERQLQGCEDWELYLRLALQYKFVAVPEFLVGYRKTPAGMSYSCDRMADSQSLMLQSIKSIAPVPWFASNLSRSSFYIHLAHQSAEAGKHQEALTWLCRSIMAEFITPLCRIEVYAVLLRALLALCQQPVVTTTKPAPTAALEPDRGRILCKQAIISLLHNCLKMAFPNYKTGSSARRLTGQSLNRSEQQAANKASAPVG